MEKDECFRRYTAEILELVKKTRMQQGVKIPSDEYEKMEENSTGRTQGQEYSVLSNSLMDLLKRFVNEVMECQDTWIKEVSTCAIGMDENTFDGEQECRIANNDKKQGKLLKNHSDSSVVGPRIIMLYAGMTGEYVIVCTDAPDEVIREHIKRTNTNMEQGIEIVNPYGWIEQQGYTVEELADQDTCFELDFSIDAEFDLYQGCAK